MKQNFKQKLLAGLLSVCMMFQTVGTVPVYAAENVMDSGLSSGTSNVCTHHVHDEKCGYTEGAPCTHEHKVNGTAGDRENPLGDTDECYTEVKNCVHEHTAECYPVQDSGEATGSDAKEPTACTHICSAESGCITKELACKHVHDNACGYKEGKPCTFDPATCESCKAKKTVDNRATLAGEVYAVYDGSKFYAATAEAPSTATETVISDKTTINHLYATGTPLMAVCTNLKTVTCADTVTSIGKRAFYGCTGLTSLAMPKVSTIGDNAFSGCTVLTSVNMPNVTTIGNQAFYDCAKLASIEMPEATLIDQQAFRGSTGLTGINLPKAITIGENAFSGCTNLERVELPEATTIGVSAFDGGLTKPVSISLPKVTSIGEFAFKDCTGLTSIDLPEATVVGGDGTSAFAGCTGLASANLPKVEVIVISAFSNCAKLTSINIPKATTIKNNAFNFCTSLASVTMPNVTTIGEYAFSGCTELTSAKMPNVTEIGERAFYNALKLTSLTLGATPPTVGKDAFTRCPTPRTLTIQGNTANSEAVLAAYKAVADGVTDELWYGWTLPTTMVATPSAGTLAVTTGNSNPTFGAENAITLTATFDKAAKVGKQRALAINEVEFKDGANTLGTIATATQNADGKWVATLNVNTKDWAVGTHNDNVK